MIRFVLSVISVNLYNDQTRCFVDRMGKYFSSLLGEAAREEIPPIQRLVITQSEELPGDGFG
ncbi:MAG TPA: hypothetical protein PKY22_11055, partial [Accumulibacter sp.]|nr:hypothetical protein [Accumulibacter sp.]